MIYHNLKYFLKKLLNSIGLGLVRESELSELKIQSAEAEKLKFDLNFLKTIGNELREKFLLEHANLNSDLRQDFMALFISGMKKNGFFVEIGAADGVFASNTLALEKNYGWNGILAELAKSWHKNLNKNRSCAISTLAVSKLSGDYIDFYESEATNLSTFVEFINFDSSGSNRRKFKTYKVKTISLEDLLNQNNAPCSIDYLSIDTEGSEFRIIENFNFEKYRIKFISIEHNYNPNREKIFQLLTHKGYERIYENISEYDDWYKLIEI